MCERHLLYHHGLGDGDTDADVTGDADVDDEGGDNDDGGVGGEGYKPQCLDLVRVALRQDFGLRKIRSH